MRLKCIKCSYESEDNLKKFNVPLCKICSKFAPNDESRFKEYIKEKIDWRFLETYRKFLEADCPQKKAMIAKATQGFIMSRPPFGYKFVDNKLIPAQNFREIEEIFEEFLTKKISLNKLSKKHNVSVNGLKKILTNFTYIGKTKFNNKIYNGNHKPIVSPILFNRVQDKLERLKRGKIK
jgi:hypothetical protein